jgi:hypothetical protein
MPSKRKSPPFILAFLALATVCCAVRAQERQELPRIAVYVTGDVPENEKKALGTRMLAALVKSGRYGGIERTETFLAEIEKEHVRQRSGAIDDSQISKLGRQFGVRYICIADITPVYRAFQVSARIVDVETAEVAFIGEAISKMNSARDFQEASDKVVGSMFGLETKRKPWMSAGAGFLINMEFGGGLVWTDEPKARISMPCDAAGAYLFFDALYGHASVGFTIGSKKWESDNADDRDKLPTMQRTSLILSLYGKYPFAIGQSQSITLFPLLGFDYEASLSGKLEYKTNKTYTFDGEGTRPNASALSAAWVKAGGGCDFNLNDNIYLRAEALYGFRSANTFENDMSKLEKNDGVAAESKFGAGISVKIGAGYRF